MVEGENSGENSKICREIDKTVRKEDKDRNNNNCPKHPKIKQNKNQSVFLHY
jgi:hypothetical protein